MNQTQWEFHTLHIQTIDHHRREVNVQCHCLQLEQTKSTGLSAYEVLVLCSFAYGSYVKEIIYTYIKLPANFFTTNVTCLECHTYLRFFTSLENKYAHRLRTLQLLFLMPLSSRNVVRMAPMWSGSMLKNFSYLDTVSKNWSLTAGCGWLLTPQVTSMCIMLRIVFAFIYHRTTKLKLVVSNQPYIKCRILVNE